MPEDAYSFVRLLDELIEELATENFEQKLNIQGLSNNKLLFFSKKSNESSILKMGKGELFCRFSLKLKISFSVTKINSGINIKVIKSKLN